MLTILSINQKKIKVIAVSLGQKPEAKTLAEYNWDLNTLTEVFIKIKKDLETKSVRVLLNDTLSHILTVRIPTGVRNERALIEQKISMHVPEILENKNWNYTFTNHGEKRKDVLVFSPIKSFLKVFSDAINKSKISIDTVEPVSLAKKRHFDPAIGLAQKISTKSKNKNESRKEEVSQKKKVTTQKIQPKAQVKLRSVATKSKQAKTSNKRLYIMCFITLPIAILLIFLLVRHQAQKGNQVVMDISKTPSPKASPALSKTPTPTVTIIPTPQPEADRPLGETPTPELSKYKVRVLNGNGISGGAGRVKDILAAKGFENISTGEAVSYDFAQTEVSIKQEIPDGLYNIIQNLLQTQYDVVKIGYLTDNNRNDIIIIAGTPKPE